MKSIEKTAKDFLFIGCVSFSLWFYLQGFIKELFLWTSGGINRAEMNTREEPVPLIPDKLLEPKEPEERVARKDALTPGNKNVDRILALIQEGKLSSHKASFYRKLPSLKDNLKEQERTK